MMNIAAAAAASAKRQGRFKEYDHIADGDSMTVEKNTEDVEQVQELPFDVSEIKLFPVRRPNLFNFNFCCDEDIKEINWKLANVANLNNLHLYTTKEPTRCELWAKMWSTSRILAEILSSRNVSQHLFDMNIIEIGAGTAVCGMIASSYGAKVLITDSSQQSLDLALKSASLNHIDLKLFKTQRINWHSLESKKLSKEEEEEDSQHQYELLIGSDVLFMEMNLLPVIEMINKYLIPGGLALILDPGRSCADDFKSECIKKSNLSVDKLMIENMVIGEGNQQLIKCAVLYLVSKKLENNGIEPVVSNSKEDEECLIRVEELKKSIIEAWTSMSKERVVSDKDLEEINYQYTYTESLSAES